MRFTRSLLVLPLFLVGALALPQPHSAELRVERAVAVVDHKDLLLPRDELESAKQSIRSPSDRSHLVSRGVGDLGASAFAGEGAPANRITALQHLLTAKGHPVGIDGQWGPETSGAVSAFQGGAGLAADSIPGPATLGALVDQIQQGDVSGVVSAAQSILGVGVDGDFGPATRDAVVAFQSANGLDADGIVGRNTWTSVFSGGGGAAPPPPPPPPPDTSGPTPGGEVPGGLPSPKPVREGQATLLAPHEVNWLAQPARYAAAAYCDASKWNDWSCKHCNGGAPSQKFYASGGGGLTPMWFVIGNGGSVVVSIRGSAGVTWLNNYDETGLWPSRSYFPGIQGFTLNGGGVMVHAGYLSAFEAMINPIMTAVRGALVENESRVLVVGHSQGGAIATMVATSLSGRVSNADVTLRAFGAPRQGNKAWADYVDSTLGDRARHVVNGNDIVPHLPPRNFGYTHSGGEVWKTDDGQWILCKGQENPMCANSVAPGTPDLHEGPYPGNVMMGC